MTPESRSRIMSAIRKRDTKPELRVRRFLHSKGLRYTLHRAGLPGCPDLVFPARRAVVLVHGCFWHRCPHCAAGRKVVRSNTNYWHPKLERNVARDVRVKQELIDQGWKVFEVWECQTSETAVLDKLAKALGRCIRRLKRSKSYPITQRLPQTLQRPANVRG
jgi:DNA mismatch endonuclease (patch repair protein)